MVTLVVLVQAPRMMLPRHKDITVYLGNSALLECQAQGLPNPNISWVLPDRSVVRGISNNEQKVMLFTNGTLQVKNTNYLDKGIYKCIASNAAGADMLSVRLQIAALPPTIQEQLWENHTVSNGQSAFMHCTAKGMPNPTIRWVTFTGAQLRPSQFINGNLLVFPTGRCLFVTLQRRILGIMNAWLWIRWVLLKGLWICRWRGALLPLESCPLLLTVLMSTMEVSWVSTVRPLEAPIPGSSGGRHLKTGWCILQVK